MLQKFIELKNKGKSRREIEELTGVDKREQIALEKYAVAEFEALSATQSKPQKIVAKDCKKCEKILEQISNEYELLNRSFFAVNQEYENAKNKINELENTLLSKNFDESQYSFLQKDFEALTQQKSKQQKLYLAAIIALVIAFLAVVLFAIFLDDSIPKIEYVKLQKTNNEITAKLKKTEQAVFELSEIKNQSELAVKQLKTDTKSLEKIARDFDICTYKLKTCETEKANSLIINEEDTPLPSPQAKNLPTCIKEVEKISELEKSLNTCLVENEKLVAIQEEKKRQIQSAKDMRNKKLYSVLAINEEFIKNEVTSQLLYPWGEAFIESSFQSVDTLAVEVPKVIKRDLIKYLNELDLDEIERMPDHDSEFKGVIRNSIYYYLKGGLDGKK